MLSPSLFALLVKDHETGWEREMPRLRRNMALYATKFWAETENQDRSSEPILVEVARAYEIVEGYQASLFSREPAVETSAGLRAMGDPVKAKAVINAWLADAPNVREAVEEASLMALIYPCSFIKLCSADAEPTAEADALALVTVEAVAPWDVLIDARAKTWEAQRFVAHRRVIPVEQARAMFAGEKPEADEESGADEDLSTVDLLGGDDVDVSDTAPRGKLGEQTLPGEFALDGDGAEADAQDKHIAVWEVYCRESGKVYFWSATSPEYWLATADYPYLSAFDRPVEPIIPFYYGYIPGKRLVGLSVLDRVASSVAEINIARTYQANAVRKVARQWLARKGAMDEEALQKLVSGVDGEVIEVDMQVGQSVGDVLSAVPHTPTPPEVQEYIRQMQSDLDRGSMMAPFSRGQATNATATEVTALAAYTASEVGRLARRRDTVIAGIARAYTEIAAVLLPPDGADLLIAGEVTRVVPDDVLGDYRIVANDGGSTPVAQAAKAQKLISALPTLQALGVSKEVLLRELVHALDLNPAFLTAVEAAPAEPGPGAGPGGSPPPSTEAPPQAPQA